MSNPKVELHILIEGPTHLIPLVTDLLCRCGKAKALDCVSGTCSKAKDAQGARVVLGAFDAARA